MYDKTDINELILLCRKRDDDAFDELVRRYTPMIRKVISGFSGCPYDSDELFAEGCVGQSVISTFFVSLSFCSSVKYKLIQWH